MEATTLVRGRYVLEGLDGDRPVVHEDAAVLLNGDRVGEIGPFDALKDRNPGAKIVGTAESAVIPGLINAHHHIGLTPLQLGSPDHPLELWFASRLALRDVDLYLDTLYSAFEMIASGVTTVQHLHSRAPGGPEQILHAAGEVIRAYRDIGMRASYSIALRDQNRLVYESDEAFLQRLPESLRPEMAEYFRRFTMPLDEQVAVFGDLHGAYKGEPRTRVQLAPANLHWLSDAALEAAAEMAERFDVPMHMHLVETPYQKIYAQKRTGGTAFAHLHRFGLTGPRMTIGHGTWMTEADIELCADTGTCLCHNCSSNLRLKSGIAPVNRYLERGVAVAIGIDEAGINDDRDILQEMRLVLRMHRVPGHGSPFPTPPQVLRMATEHAAKTTPFAAEIGRLSPGLAADLTVLDWRAVTRPYQSGDIPFVDVLVQRAKSTSVRSVMVAGELIYDDGRFTRVDRDAALDEIEARLAAPLTEAEERRRRLARDVFPYVAALYDDESWEVRPKDPFYRWNDRA